MLCHGLAILTFVTEESPPDTRRRLPETLRTLEQTDYPGRIVIVDDGSNCAEYQAYLSHLNYEVIQREENGGVSRGKNTCLRVLMEGKIDIGFLTDDDVDFHPGWWQQYLEAHAQTGIHHFSWADDSKPLNGRKCDCIVRGYRIVQTSYLNGILLTFTREVIKQVGGFRIFPAKWGHEHTNWTKRIVYQQLAPCWCDIVDSNRYLTLNRFSDASSVTDAQKSRWSHMNVQVARDMSRSYFPLEE